MLPLWEASYNKRYRSRELIQWVDDIKSNLFVGEVVSFSVAAGIETTRSSVDNFANN